MLISLHTNKIQKNSTDEPDIRIFIDPKLENEEKKIDDTNFSTVENVCTWSFLKLFLNLNIF